MADPAALVENVLKKQRARSQAGPGGVLHRRLPCNPARLALPCKNAIIDAEAPTYLGAMSVEPNKASRVVVDTYETWRDKRGISRQERSGPGSALNLHSCNGRDEFGTGRTRAPDHPALVVCR
jgi:hypothetical protein